MLRTELIVDLPRSRKALQPTSTACCWAGIWKNVRSVAGPGYKIELLIILN